VIGAGIIGVCAANWLQRDGHTGLADRARRRRRLVRHTAGFNGSAVTPMAIVWGDPAGGFDVAALVIPDLGVDKFAAARLRAAQRAFLICPYETRLATATLAARFAASRRQPLRNRVPAGQVTHLSVLKNLRISHGFSVS
jgi:glycine/D-amino acid oxidase-like deaminating enzyme